MKKSDIGKQMDHDHILRKRYKDLAKEYHEFGLNENEVRRSKEDLCFQADNKYILESITYKPTGVALGHPLPDQDMTENLWEISNSVEQYLRDINHESDKCFAFVPKDSYHITLVNYSHFDCDKNITSITQNEIEKVRQAISKLNIDSVKIQFNGLIITSSGRLILQGFPTDDRFYRLRQTLYENVTELRVNTPKTAHVKSGHILTQLSLSESESLFQKVVKLGTGVNFSLTFDDVYTPVERIALKEL